ncbi:hypothetical protein WME89_10655 [Sorangium sp. So ce321]|uniref:hypothetical protein n=1 Tax=Sorangium sp. So ce321 TaxID=3133300 RepID=UPI003F60DC78
MYGSEGASGYVIPRYRAPADAPWYHVLHGNIPGHQIDFMYCPEVPQGPLTTTHFSHLARLMKYIEPATGSTHAFAIGNLSRDDTQHEPGHGAVGLIFGFRIGGAVDHAGRGNPPFAHGLVAVDRDLGYATLLEASATFYRHVMNATELNSSAGMFYREYVGAVREAPERVPHVLERYVEEYGDLPYLRRSSATWDWVADEGTLPKRVVIVHKHDEPFGAIAHAAARIATVLYRSNIKWTSITSGREADIPGGVSVRFVRERDVSMEERHGVLIRIEEVAEDEGEIARGMFGARPSDTEPERPRYAGGWREKYAAQQAGGAAHLAQTAGGVVQAGPVSEGRRAPSSPPGHRRGEASAHADAQSAALAPMSSAAAMGPKGTLVIDTDKLLRGAGLGEASSGHAAAGGAVLGVPGLSSGATGRVPYEPARGGAAAARPPPPMGAGARAPAQAPMPAVAARSDAAGDDLAEIPIVVEQPRRSRKGLWVVAAIGCAAAAGAAAWVVTSRGPAEQPAPPATEGPGAATGAATTAAPGAKEEPGTPDPQGAAPAPSQSAGSPGGASTAEASASAEPSAPVPRQQGRAGRRAPGRPAATGDQSTDPESDTGTGSPKTRGAIQPKVKW